MVILPEIEQLDDDPFKKVVTTGAIRRPVVFTGRATVQQVDACTFVVCSLTQLVDKRRGPLVEALFARRKQLEVATKEDPDKEDAEKDLLQKNEVDGLLVGETLVTYWKSLNAALWQSTSLVPKSIHQHIASRILLWIVVISPEQAQGGHHGQEQLQSRRHPRHLLRVLQALRSHPARGLYPQLGGP